MVPQAVLIGAGWAFIHNPKTGGESIRQALPGRKTGNRHAPRSALAGDLFTFGFVRNPWERLLSLYLFMCRTPASRQWKDRGAWIRAGFKAWLLDGQHWETRDRMVPPLQRRPQSWWLDGCDFVGRFENIQTDFGLVCERIGEARRPLPCVNRGGDYPSTAEIYDAAMSEAVATWFAPDIDQWGYGGP